MSYRSAVALLLGLTVLVADLPAQASADSNSAVRWDLLGHFGDGNVSWLAAPPDGLGNGLIFATAGATSRISHDGGKTWASTSMPTGRAFVAPAAASAFSLATDGLYRSTDGGTTWSSVLAFSQPLPQDLFQSYDPSTGQMLFSPIFQSDGKAFLFVSGQLWRSTDGGGTWASVDPGAGQYISVLQLSPAFATDQTVIAAAISEPPPRFPNAAALPTDNADSLGVLVSTDGGATWSATPGQPAIGSDPYQQVMSLALSSTYAQDHTLFAAALGPWTQLSPYTVVSDAVFRSQDGGATWTLAFQPSSAVTVGDRLVLSPSFSSDGTVLLGHSTGFVSPASGTCDFFVSNDGGSSWAEPSFNGLHQNYSGCFAVGATTLNGGATLLASLATQGGVSWSRSADRGQSWQSLNAPGGGDGIATVVLPDLVLQPGRQGDLFEYAALPPCSTQPALGFGTVWNAHPEVQDQLGCPLGPEQLVTLQTRHVSGNAPGDSTYDLYWVAGLSDVCERVYADDSVGQGGAADTCSGPGSSTRQGSVLRFPGGVYWLFVAGPPGNGFVVAPPTGSIQHL